MAISTGVGQVVATMVRANRGTSPTCAIRPRVVLMFDADKAGDDAVDKALAIFASHDIDWRSQHATGLDPCDMLVRDGAQRRQRFWKARLMRWSLS